MTIGQSSPEELAQDLVATMRQLEPLLKAMLAVMQNADRSTETQIEALTALLERIAGGLETTTQHLQTLGPRMHTQEIALQELSAQVAGLGQRFDRQNRLENRMEELVDLLRG